MTVAQLTAVNDFIEKYPDARVTQLIRCVSKPIIKLRLVKYDYDENGNFKNGEFVLIEIPETAT